MPGKCSHSCPLAAFLLSLLLALLFMAASSSYPTRSSDRARNAATQISTTFRTSPKQRPERFNRVCVNVAAYILAASVVDGFMRHVGPCELVTWILVSHDQ